MTPPDVISIASFTSASTISSGSVTVEPSHSMYLYPTDNPSTIIVADRSNGMIRISGGNNLEDQKFKIVIFASNNIMEVIGVGEGDANWIVV